MPASVMAWGWAIAAVAIALLELVAPGTYLIWIACAAAITAIATFLVDWSLSTQLTIFIASSLGTCVVGYFVYQRLNAEPAQDQGTINRRDLDMLGATAVAAESFANGQGRVRIGDSVWLAQSEDDIAAGMRTKVVSVHGTMLIVRRSDRGG